MKVSWRFRTRNARLWGVHVNPQCVATWIVGLTRGLQVLPNLQGLAEATDSLNKRSFISKRQLVGPLAEIGLFNRPSLRSCQAAPNLWRKESIWCSGACGFEPAKVQTNSLPECETQRKSGSILLDLLVFASSLRSQKVMVLRVLDFQ